MPPVGANSGFRRAVDEICALLGNYAANSGNSLPTFRDNLMISSSRVKNPRRKREERFLTQKLGRTDCPETSVSTYHYTLRNFPEQHKSYFCYDRSLDILSYTGHPPLVSVN
jgi:hypothetical protein